MALMMTVMGETMTLAPLTMKEVVPMLRKASPAAALGHIGLGAGLLADMEQQDARLSPVSFLSSAGLVTSRFHLSR